MGRTFERETVETLRQRAEGLMRRSRRRETIQPILERLIEAAPGGSDHALFAHRHLGELLLEQRPWVAALHLRQLLHAQKADHVVHALMGLCQALLGNFRSAVSAYRRALRLAPRNPWYHHNLGHLLDVALGSPSAAVDHLRKAHEAEPLEHEITASLAHCLATLERLDEAYALADEAVRMAPRNKDHRALLAWIERGAPAAEGPKVGVRPAGGSPEEPTPPPAIEGTPAGEAVSAAFERGMLAAGFSQQQVERARVLWGDFRGVRSLRIQKPEVYAAAVEYAIALVHGIHGMTQASVARRYGVATTSVSSRFGEIRDALELAPGDPRYAGLS